MITRYQGYWDAKKMVKSEIQSTSKWDTWNDTKYKEAVEAGELTSQEVAEMNHANNFTYEVSFFEDIMDEYPVVFCEIMVRSQYVGVHFIDPAGREYLSYSFRPSKKIADKVFLRESWFVEYLSEDSDRMKKRIHFVFDEEGNVSTRVYDMLRKKTLDYEGKEPIDPSGLYEDYPEFGQYEGITKLERDIPFDIVK